MVERTITPDVRLQLIALIVTAGQHVIEAYRLERAASKLIGSRDVYDDHLREILYSSDGCVPTTQEVDDALKKAGITVEGDPLADAAKAMAANLEAADEARTDPIFSDAADIIRKLVAGRATQRTQS